MNFDPLLKKLARLMFVAAAAVMALAFIEGITLLFGISLIRNMYAPGRLLELAATLLVFVIAVLLRQIRIELQKKNAA